MSTDTPARAPRQRAAALTPPSAHLGARCVRPWREARLRVGPWRRVWYGASHELACCSPRARSCVWPLTPVRPLPPQKRKSKKQLRQLEELFFGSSREFDPDVRVTSDLIGEAMERTGLEEKQIRQWFQYKRNKARVVTTSHDPLLVAYNVSGRGVFHTLGALLQHGLAVSDVVRRSLCGVASPLPGSRGRRCCAARTRR